MIYEIVPARLEHIRTLSRTMRAWDAAEILGWGLCVRHTLHFLYRDSPLKRTALVDGQVAAVWGVQGPMLSDDAMPWLFTTPAMERVRKAFLREARNEINDLLGLYRRLRCYVLADYHESIRFFGAVGFSFGAAQPIGKDGTSYRLMTIERKAVPVPMSGRYRIVPARDVPSGQIAMYLREASERILTRGGSPREWFRDHIRRSDEAWVALMGDAPVAVWGYIGKEIWFNLSDSIRRHPHLVARAALHEMTRMKDRAIEGKIIASDKLAWRFAEFLGLTVWQDEPMNANGTKYLPISRMPP